MSNFWENTDLGQKVDPAHAASVLGSVLRVFGTGGGPTDPANDPTGGATSPTAPASTDTTTTPTDPNAPTDGSTSNPISGAEPISQGFGGESGHPGVDLAVPVGTPVLSAVSGKVTVASGGQGGYGNLVEVTTPDGIVTRYGHLSGIQAQAGAEVKAGQQIGISGGAAGAEGAGNSTGPHLHFEVDINGKPVDPSSYLAAGPKILGHDPAATPAPAVQSGASPVTQPAAVFGTDKSAHDPANEGVQQTSSTGTTSTPGQSTIPSGATGADSDPGAVDAFLNATKQHESGGNYQARYSGPAKSDAAGAYQFLSTTWKSAGGSTASADQASPAEQDAVARNMALQLFNEFHSWRLVAIAWYGGPGKAEEVARGQDPGSPEGQGPYLAYGDTIANMMSGGK